MKVKILSHTPNPDLLVATAAKNCYSSSSIDALMEKQTDESVQKFINHLTDIKHMSPLEHVSFTFAIEGVSRSLLAQLTRHRIASFSVQSQRYINMNNFDYIIPQVIKDNPNALRVFEDAIETDRNAYREIYDYIMSEYLLERYSNIGCPCDSKRYFYLSIEAYIGVNGDDNLQKKFASDYKIAEKIANENARAVLPNAATTNIVMTMNVRELLHFFELRCCNRAQDEIRELADRMLVLCKEVSPLLFKNAGAKCMHGNCSEGNMSCGNHRTDEDIKIYKEW